MSYFTNGDIVERKRDRALFVCFQGKLFQMHDETKETRAIKYKYTDFTRVGDIRSIGARASEKDGRPSTSYEGAFSGSSVSITAAHPFASTITSSATHAAATKLAESIDADILEALTK